MSDARTDHDENAGTPPQAGPSFQLYMKIFYALSVFTALSFVFNELARLDIITYTSSVALIVLVAVCKALCVVTIFMHLKYDWGRVYCIVIPVSILAVMMIIVLLPDIVLGWHHGLYEATEAVPTIAGH
jgi:caa(3)-type oxidase subunit IV